MKAKVLTYYSLFLFYLNLARRNIEMRQIQQSQEAICKVFQSILWSDLSNSRFDEGPKLYLLCYKLHKQHKGIIHTTSYEQLNFIRENISKENRRRLLETDPEVQRDEIIEEHFKTTKPTVLISPSLHLGLDLKDDLSRFQVIVKVPYPSLADRWINETSPL